MLNGFQCTLFGTAEELTATLLPKHNTRNDDLSAVVRRFRDNDESYDENEKHWITFKVILVGIWHETSWLLGLTLVFILLFRSYPVGTELCLIDHWKFDSTTLIDKNVRLKSSKIVSKSKKTKEVWRTWKKFEELERNFKNLKEIKRFKFQVDFFPMNDWFVENVQWKKRLKVEFRYFDQFMKDFLIFDG